MDLITLSMAIAHAVRPVRNQEPLFVAGAVMKVLEANGINTDVIAAANHASTPALPAH